MTPMNSINAPMTPTSPTNPLFLLRDLFSAHERMSLLAEKLEWDKVTAEWPAAEALFGKLQALSLVNLSPAERTEAQTLIKKILALQAAVSAKVKPWMTDVKPLLDSFDRFPLSL